MSSMGKKNRPAPPGRVEDDGKPVHVDRGDGEGREGTAHDDEGPIAILTAGLETRLAGGTPSPEVIAAARERAGQDDLKCWNGKSLLKPDCHNIGSQNIPPVARAAMGDWQWLGRLARVWCDEGVFGKELGANSLLYSVTVLKALVWALGEARQVRALNIADDLRTAVRAAVAFFATTAVPVARRHTTILTTDKRFPRAERDERNGPATSIVVGSVMVRATSVVAGNRWTIQRGGFDGDAGSVVIRGAIDQPAAWGLTDDEGTQLASVLLGNVEAARSIFHHVNDGGWMLGTVNVPGETVWHFVAERFVDSASMRFHGPWPNGNTKMVCGYSKLEEDGTWTSAKAWPEGYDVREDGEYIVVRDNKGEVAVERLTGTLLWTVEIEGNAIRFNAS